MNASIRSPSRPLRNCAFACAILLAFAACSKGRTPKLPPTLGTRLSEAPARGLAATADGAHLVFISDVKPPQDKEVPEGLMIGALATVPATGGAVRVLGQGVTTLEGAFQLSPDSRFVAFLSGFKIDRHVGALQLADLAREEEVPKVLGEAVSFYRFSQDGRWLGYVASGALHLFEIAKGRDLLVERDVATFEFSADGRALLFRKPLAAGGLLRLAALGDEGASEISTVAERAGDYGFSPDGRFYALTARVEGPGAPYQLLVAHSVATKPSALGDQAGSFTFSPDSKFIAFVANQTPGMPYGDLFVAGLAGGAEAGAPRQIGESVADFRFAPTSDAIALRENQRNERGQMWQEFKVVRLPSGEVRLHQKALPKAFINFLFSDDGRELAFIKHIKADLNLWRLDMTTSAPPELVAPWTFEYRFPRPKSGEAQALWYRGACIREGRQCDLFEAVKAAVPADTKADQAADTAMAEPNKAASEGKEERALPAPVHPKIASAISNFELSPSGTRLFLDLPRLDTVSSFDLAWQPVAKGALPTTIDRHVLKGSLHLLDPEGKRVAYIVTERQREGVYLAALE